MSKYTSMQDAGAKTSGLGKDQTGESSAETGETTSDDPKALTAGNWISLTALLVSLSTFSWNTVDALRGAQVDMMSPIGRSIEFRCTYSAASCWEKETGLVNVIAPAFFTNAGANRYNGVVERVTLQMSFGRTTADFAANDIWLKTQTGKNTSTPFVPLVIAGTSAGGAELKFVPYKEPNRISWKNFAAAIIRGDIKKVHITVRAHLSLGEAMVEKSCTVVVTERLRGILIARQKKAKHRYLTIGCSEYSETTI